MKRIRAGFVAWAWLALALLSGCAASGRSYTAVSSELPSIKENGCRVVFYRTDSMVGAALQPEIRLDHQVVGKSQPGGFFYVDTSPGRHVATSQTETEAALEFDVQAGQTVYVSSSITLGLLVGRGALLPRLQFHDHQCAIRSRRSGDQVEARELCGFGQGALTRPWLC